MTQEEIIEGNKTIAEFMGYKYLPEHILNGEKGAFVKDDKLSIHAEFIGKQFCAKYRTSWDWLMPVVEKINTMANVRIQVGICSITRLYINTRRYAKENNISLEEVPPIAESDEESFIGNVWLAVVEFIKWYNIQTVSKTKELANTQTT
jgi:hypothetical protein